ncbi:MAG: SusF/SusE family outer membrane protein [Chlorobi bacterium]|nr:SusF/SusE family outer membrane protein [Chlorobiota bacterium]
MKKYLSIITAILGFVIFYSCETENNNPVLNTANVTAPEFTNPANGTSFILLKDSADTNLTTFTWSEANYGIDNLPSATYTLEMDIADSNFVNVLTLQQSPDLSYSITVGDMNNKLLGMGLTEDVASNVAFRVIGRVNESLSEAVSQTLTLSFTPYSDDVSVNAEPIYLLGGATTAGWDNTLAIAAQYLPDSGSDSTYSVVDLLKPNGTDGSDGFVKFIRYLGAWAPQWGSDGAGTWESGVLVLRATEADPDPTPIPAPDVEDDYIITVDIVNLTYTITETVQTLHIIGDATEAGWDNNAAIAMTKDAPGKFSLVANLSADATEGFKFLEYQGQWAPMYGQDGNGTFESGKLQYRPTEDVADPMSIPPPSITGSYLIEVNIAAGTYKVTQQ